MTSTARSDMRLARSWMVIASGIVTSRTNFSFGSLEAMPLSRCVRRRNEATERSRTSSARSAVTKREAAALLFDATARGGAGCGWRTRCAGPARAGSFVVIGLERESGSRPGSRGFVRTEALLGDFAGLAFGFLVVLAAVFFLALARFGGFPFAAVDRLAAGAAACFFFSDLALFGVAHARVGECVRAGAALFLGEGAQHDARRLWLCFGRRWLQRVRLVRRGALLGTGFFVSTTGAGSALASPGPPTARRLTFSTTTCLLRPWLKL